MENINKAILTNAKKRSNSKVNKKVKTPNKGQEKRCVDNFRYLGKSEIETPLGFVDLITDSYIIEFKHYLGAKAALGQILAYSHFIKNKKKMVVLFGKGLSTWKKYTVFERVCSTYDVHVFKLSSSHCYEPLKKLLES